MGKNAVPLGERNRTSEAASVLEHVQTAESARTPESPSQFREMPRQLWDELTEAERLVDELFDELQRMRSEAAMLRSHRDELATTVQSQRLELTGLKAKVDEARGDLDRQRERSREELEFQRLAAAEELESLRKTTSAEKDQLAGKLAEALAEKAQLGTELDLTRTLAAENKRKWNDCRRELSAERKLREGELASLHQLVERFFGRWSEEVVAHASLSQSSVAPSRRAASIDPSSSQSPEPQIEPVEPDAKPAPNTSGELEAKPSAAGDPVVHSVMAQFTKLQKDVARRRGKRS